jgi:hypothetical protein
MRRIRDVLGVCGLLLAVAVGCATSDSNQVRPPKGPEEFRAPPETDPRYSRPIEYPKDTMDQDAILKKAKDAAKSPGPGATRPGMGNGVGGRGF